LVSKLPEDGRVVPKHFAVIKVCNDVYAVCAFGWLSKKIRWLKCMQWAIS